MPAASTTGASSSSFVDVWDYKEHVEALMAEHPGTGCRVMAKLLKERCHISLAVGVSSLDRLMKAIGDGEAEAMAAARALRKRPAASDYPVIDDVWAYREDVEALMAEHPGKGKIFYGQTIRGAVWHLASRWGSERVAAAHESYRRWRL